MDGAWGLRAGFHVQEEHGSEQQRPSWPQVYTNSLELACQRQKKCMKSSVECKWNLAEAQQKLKSLALHNSESIDQEQAKAQKKVSELKQGEEEWRQKEVALVQEERIELWNLDAISEHGFNKSFINQQNKNEVKEEDKSKPFIEKYEGKIRHFGMLNRWSDSQNFLSNHPDLVCDETAKHLHLWCFHLETEQKRALMEQVAHQAVVMQFIVEMAKSCNVDPRSCFRLFFQKAQAGEAAYSEAFTSELEAFKERVRLFSDSSRSIHEPVQHPVICSGLAPAGLSDYKSKNMDCHLMCHMNTELCSFSGTGYQDDDEWKMMDTA